MAAPGRDSNFYELGTGHQCNDQYRYWYWGLSANGQWTSLGSQAGITNGVQHLFRMDRQATGQSTYAIYYRIDGVTKRTFTTGAVVGTVLDVGLESYCQGCVVDGYSNQDLKYLKAGVWSFWAGQDGQQANDPPMCGHWAGVTVWWSGEEAAC